MAPSGAISKISVTLSARRIESDSPRETGGSALPFINSDVFLVGSSDIFLIGFACMPSPLLRQVRWNLSARTLPPSSAFPGFKAGRPLHQPFRGLLSVCSTLRPASPCNPLTPKAPAASLPPPLLRLLPGGANRFPGWAPTRCGPAPFHGALEPVACFGTVRAGRWVSFDEAKVSSFLKEG
jgi:hypothetical protein